MSALKSQLLPVDDLINRLIAHAYQRSLSSEFCSLDEALDRVLAAPIISIMNVPPFDNSAMDGYAMAWQPDLLHKNLTVSQVSPAGQASCDLIENTAVRILTGAPIPTGANVVIMQENVTCTQIDSVNDHNKTIQINVQPELGVNVRRAGQDIAKDAVVCAIGTRITAAEVGLIASLGIHQVEVFRTLRVSVIATGDELVQAGQPLADGQIYNSNTPLLSALLKRLHIEIVRAIQLPDQPELLKQALIVAASDSDLILTTGGASVGDADHLKDVLQQIGRIENWKIAIKPGKPLVWGEVTKVNGQNIPLMGLPGNPQSVWVTFLIVVLPYLRALQGQRTRLLPQSIKVPAGFARNKPQGRREYLRVQLVDGQLIQHPNQSSGALMSASWADGFAVVEIGATVEKGELVSYIPMSGVLGM
jgi:molybdopterin molybdotransferase